MKLCKALFALLLLPIMLFADHHHHHHHEVGPLSLDGIVVTDLEAAVTQWQTGTGNQFGSIQTNTYKVHIPHHGSEEVTLRSSFSSLNSPFIELVEATPAIGPWAPAEDNGRAPGYLGYAVDNVEKVGRTLEDAGFKLVAESRSNFAFYKGVNGVLVKLVRQDLIPATGGVNTPQAPLVFGPIHHTDVVVYDYKKTQKQFVKGLNITFNQPGVEVLGSILNYSGVGVVPTDVNFIYSNNLPLIQVGVGTPHLGGYLASPTTSGFRPVYEVPTGTVATHRDQLLAAGFVLNTLFEIAGTPYVAVFSAPQGYWIEIVDASLD